MRAVMLAELYSIIECMTGLPNSSQAVLYFTVPNSELTNNSIILHNVVSVHLGRSFPGTFIGSNAAYSFCLSCSTI